MYINPGNVAGIPVGTASSQLRLSAPEFIVPWLVKHHDSVNAASVGLIVYFVNATNMAKPNAIQLLMADLNTYNVDVAVIAETWFNCKVPDDTVSMEYYELIRLDQNPSQKRKGGGICVYVESNIKYLSTVTLLSLI